MHGWSLQDVQTRWCGMDNKVIIVGAVPGVDMMSEFSKPTAVPEGVKLIEGEIGHLEPELKFYTWSQYHDTADAAKQIQEAEDKRFVSLAKIFWRNHLKKLNKRKKQRRARCK